MIVPLISVLLLLLAGSGHLANIDTSQPIVFEYPFPLSHSPLFGYSVLALGNNQFIIGAPNASLAEKFSRIQSTGAIFRCIVDLSQQTSTCRTIEISDPRNQSLTKDMRLGESLLATSANEYLACAPAFTNQLPDYNAHLTWLNPSGSCFAFEISGSRLKSIIRPLTDPGDQYHSSTSYYYSHAMSGFASATTKSTKNQTRLFLSTPGFDNWQGGFIEVDLPKTLNPDPFSSPLNQKTVIQHPPVNSPHKRDFYLGYSMCSGKFFSSKLNHMALGAPRQGVHYVGSVYVFNLDGYYSGIEETAIVLNGNQTGEYFGSSLLAVDLNGDGLDDLLVGAPMYCSFKKGFADEGRVFVYLSDGKKFRLSSTLYGSSLTDARFGTSMASVGDLDHNGFNDVAIGAPYENEHRGSVYIYQSSSKGLKLSQRISAADHLSSLNLRGFGFSFSSQAFDVDQNRFNDIVIGAVDSNNAVLLRPIIVLEASIMLYDKYVDLKEPCQYLSDQEKRQFSYPASCFKMKYCFNTKNFGQYQMEVNTVLVLDRNNRRCFIRQYDPESNQPVNNAREISQIMILNRQVNPICSDPYIVLMENEKSIRNIEDPISLDLSYKPSVPDENSNLFQVPLFDKFNTSTTVDFQLCKNKECISKLKLEPKVILDNLVITNHSQKIELVEGLVHKVTVKIDVRNLGDTAIGSKVNITTTGSALSLITSDEQCTETHTEHSTVLSCTLDYLIYQNEIATLLFVFNPFNIHKAKKVVFSITGGAKNPPTLIKKQIEFINKKYASIEMKPALDSIEPVLFRQDEKTVPFTRNIRLSRKEWSSIDSVKLQLFYPAEHHDRQFVTNVTLKSTTINIICEPAKIIIRSNQLSTLKETNATQKFFLDCANKLLTCRVIECQLGPFSHKIKELFFEVKGQLQWPALRDRFQNYQFTEIEFHSTLIARIEDANIDTSGQVEPEIAVDFQFKAIFRDKEFPTWIIYVAIIVGLLILLLIILILFKCGFFRRKKPLLEGSEAQPLNSPET